MRLLLILLFGLAARAQDIEHALQKQYEKQIFALRHPLQGSTQEYDSDGQVLKGNTEGPWTVYGYLKIEKLALRADIVQLEGSRVEYRFSDTPKQHASPKITKHVTVRIRLQKIPGSLDEANLVMGRVFALTKRDLLDSRPEIWRQYLDNDTFLPLLGDKPAAVSADQPPAEDRPQQTNTSASGAHEAARTTLKVKDTDQPPEPVYTPEPAFTEDARREHVQGVVVLAMMIDERGNVSRVRILRPLGMGLDESAANTVKSWRFKPAQLRGQAVAVDMNIEVSFNLVR